MSELIIQIQADSGSKIVSELRTIIQNFYNLSEVEDCVVSVGSRYHFVCKLETDNAAFSDLLCDTLPIDEERWDEVNSLPDPSSIALVTEVCRILEAVAIETAKDIQLSKKLVDINGNTVGRAEICKNSQWMGDQTSIQTAEQKVDWAIARLKKITETTQYDKGTTSPFDILHDECESLLSECQTLLSELTTGQLVDREPEDNLS